MEGSRTRTLLGVGLVLVGGMLLLRTLLAPIVFSGPAPLVNLGAGQLMQEAQQAQLEAQQAQLEAQQAQQEAQLEAQQAQQEAQQEARQAQLEAQQAQQEAQSAMQNQLPELPPMPPAPPAFGLGMWLNPAVVVLALLLVLVWRRGRCEQGSRQV
jgi:hypothetical protein